MSRRSFTAGRPRPFRCSHTPCVSPPGPVGPRRIIARLKSRQSGGRHDQRRRPRVFRGRQGHWHARDADALAKGHAVTGTIISPIFGRRAGRDAIRQSYQALFTTFPTGPSFKGDARFSTERASRCRFPSPPRTSASSWGRRHESPVPDSRRDAHRDGRRPDPAEERLYDFTGFLIQVGVLRAKPGKD